MQTKIHDILKKYNNSGYAISYDNDTGTVYVYDPAKIKAGKTPDDAVIESFDNVLFPED